MIKCISLYVEGILILTLFLWIFGWLTPFLISEDDSLLVLLGYVTSGVLAPILLGCLVSHFYKKVTNKGKNHDKS